ncbi:MAG TPA: hypothetical protein VIT91_08660 [Chthoniobacterales bacterium]
MQRPTFRPSRPLKAAVYISFSLLLLTGAAWLYAQGQVEDDEWRKIPPLLMKIHGGAAMAALLVLGALTSHVTRGWKADKNRLSGVLLTAVSAFLILTGYGLYYTSGEELREWLSLWHAWIGFGLGLLLPAHVIAGRLIMRASHRRRHPDAPPRVARE